MSLQDRLLTALVACLLLLGAMPIGPVAAAETLPPHDLVRPRAMNDASEGRLPAGAAATQRAPSPTVATPPNVGGGGSRPLREVFGFVNAGNLADPEFGYPSWNFSALSTVAFFGLHVNAGDGNLVRNDANWTAWNSPALVNLVSVAHRNGVRVVVALLITSGDLCGPLSKGTVTIPQIIAEVNAKGVDGINIDYEGYNGSCGTADPSRARHLMTEFTHQLRAALPAAQYLSIDTYASSAADPYGFFDIPGLAPFVDSFFVMAYDLDMSNRAFSPPGCAGTSYCLSPVAPLAGYHYNDTSTVAQYTAAFPGAAAKTILGVPYYGTKGCVAAPVANATVISGGSSPTYTYAAAAATTPGVSGFTSHIDSLDPAGQEQWDTWFSSTYNCTREQYWDTATSLGLKYDLVNRAGLRGVGIFTLDYGGASPELWSALASHFALIPSAPIAVSACVGDAGAVVSWLPPPFNGAPVTSYTVTAWPGGTAVTVAASHGWAQVNGLSNGTSYTFTVTAANAYGVGVASAATAPAIAAARTTAWPGQTHPLALPRRLVDTRSGTGGVATIGPLQSLEVSIAGQVGIPATGVGAAVLNVTVTNPTADGFLTAYPGGGCHNVTSDLNFRAGQTVPGLVTASLGANGKVAFYNGSGGSVDVIVDLQAWISDAPSTAGPSGRFRSLTPARLVDTRSDAGSAPLASRQSRSFPVLGRAGLPGSGVAAVLMNLTVTDTAGGSGYLVAYDAGAPPLASNVNFTAGQTAANRVLARLARDGSITVFNGSGAPVAVVIDINGWFSDESPGATGGLFTGIASTRIVDTRDGTGGPVRPVAGVATLIIPATTFPTVPRTGVGALVFKLTVTGTSVPGYFTAYPTRDRPPLSSDLNFAGYDTTANLAIVGIGPDGGIELFNGSAAPADVIVDLVGWISS